jgi:hypothetical protein
MDSTRLFRHQDYELQCGATCADSSRFVPSLVVSRPSWPRRPRVIAVQRGEHCSQETAIDGAHAQGIAWIRDYG